MTFVLPQSYQNTLDLYSRVLTCVTCLHKRHILSPDFHVLSQHPLLAVVSSDFRKLKRFSSGKTKQNLFQSEKAAFFSFSACWGKPLSKSQRKEEKKKYGTDFEFYRSLTIHLHFLVSRKNWSNALFLEMSAWCPCQRCKPCCFRGIGSELFVGTLCCQHRLCGSKWHL